MSVTCYRCGREFERIGNKKEIVCPICRVPKIKGRKPISKEMTFREKQIAKLVCDGKLNKEIAWELKLTEGTIKEYLNRIFRKVGTVNRTQLAMWWIKKEKENGQSI